MSTNVWGDILGFSKSVWRAKTRGIFNEGEGPTPPVSHDKWTGFCRVFFEENNIKIVFNTFPSWMLEEGKVEWQGTC